MAFGSAQAGLPGPGQGLARGIALSLPDSRLMARKGALVMARRLPVTALSARKIALPGLGGQFFEGSLGNGGIDVPMLGGILGLLFPQGIAGGVWMGEDNTLTLGVPVVPNQIGAGVNGAGWGQVALPPVLAREEPMSRREARRLGRLDARVADLQGAQTPPEETAASGEAAAPETPAAAKSGARDFSPQGKLKIAPAQAKLLPTLAPDFFPGLRLAWINLIAKPLRTGTQGFTGPAIDSGGQFRISLLPTWIGGRVQGTALNGVLDLPLVPNILVDWLPDRFSGTLMNSRIDVPLPGDFVQNPPFPLNLLNSFVLLPLPPGLPLDYLPVNPIDEDVIHTQAGQNPSNLRSTSAYHKAGPARPRKALEKEGDVITLPFYGIAPTLGNGMIDLPIPGGTGGFRRADSTHAPDDTHLAYPILSPIIKGVADLLGIKLPNGLYAAPYEMSGETTTPGAVLLTLGGFPSTRSLPDFVNTLFDEGMASVTEAMDMGVPATPPNGTSLFPGIRRRWSKPLPLDTQTGVRGNTHGALINGTLFDGEWDLPVPGSWVVEEPAEKTGLDGGFPPIPIEPVAGVGPDEEPAGCKPPGACNVSWLDLPITPENGVLHNPVKPASYLYRGDDVPLVARLAWNSADRLQERTAAATPLFGFFDALSKGQWPPQDGSGQPNYLRGSFARLAVTIDTALAQQAWGPRAWMDALVYPTLGNSAIDVPLPSSWPAGVIDIPPVTVEGEG